MGGTKLPLKHKAFAKRLRSRGVGDGGKAGKQRFWPKPRKWLAGGPR